MRQLQSQKQAEEGPRLLDYSFIHLLLIRALWEGFVPGPESRRKQGREIPEDVEITTCSKEIEVHNLTARLFQTVILTVRTTSRDDVKRETGGDDFLQKR